MGVGLHKGSDWEWVGLLLCDGGDFSLHMICWSDLPSCI